MWSKNFDRCVVCEKTEAKHMAKGKCVRCYGKQYREAGENSARISESKRQWYRRFRTDNLLKEAERRNRKHFNGVREKVLIRDKRRCTKCGVNRNLIVHHKDGNGRGKENPNNDLNNLTTLCRSCHVAEHRQELLAARKAKRTIPCLNKFGKWSLKYPCCQKCGTVYSKHASGGLCQGCYLQRYRISKTR